MRLTGFQQVCLVTLRTAIGWHFAYEGFYKLMLPGWSRSGQLMAPFSAQGYLRGATGPLAALFHGVAGNASMMHAVDIAVPLALLLVGLSLMLGLFTQAGCAGALAFLALFYLSQPPLSGMPQTGAEGAYLIVNKRVNIFGTMYNPDEDFARIPLQRVALPTSIERLTVGVVDNNFRIAWGDAAWVAPIKR